MTAPGTADALSLLGGDLTFSISWSVATELLQAAREAQLGESELIAIVLGLSVMLMSIPEMLASIAAGSVFLRKYARLRWSARRKDSAASSAASSASESGAGAKTPGDDASTEDANTPTVARPSVGLLTFVKMFVSIFQRICVSIAVQLLAANVRVEQQLRVARVLTLLAVAVFFLFLEATATVGRV